MNSNTSKVMVAILAGTAIGTSLGILFAPDKGKNTRGKIKQKTLDTSHHISESISHTKDELTRIANEKKAEFDKKMETTISNLSHKAEDIINNLEDKLEDLKRKNAALQK